MEVPIKSSKHFELNLTSNSFTKDLNKPKQPNIVENINHSMDSLIFHTYEEYSLSRTDISTLLQKIHNNHDSFPIVCKKLPTFILLNYFGTYILRFPRDIVSITRMFATYESELLDCDNIANIKENGMTMYNLFIAFMARYDNITEVDDISAFIFLFRVLFSKFGNYRDNLIKSLWDDDPELFQESMNEANLGDTVFLIDHTGKKITLKQIIILMNCHRIEQFLENVNQLRDEDKFFRDTVFGYDATLQACFPDFIYFEKIPSEFSATVDLHNIWKIMIRNFDLINFCSNVMPYTTEDYSIIIKESLFHANLVIFRDFYHDSTIKFIEKRDKDFFARLSDKNYHYLRMLNSIYQFSFSSGFNYSHICPIRIDSQPVNVKGSKEYYQVYINDRNHFNETELDSFLTNIPTFFKLCTASTRTDEDRTIFKFRANEYKVNPCLVTKEILMKIIRHPDSSNEIFIKKNAYGFHVLDKKLYRDYETEVNNDILIKYQKHLQKLHLRPIQQINRQPPQSDLTDFLGSLPGHVFIHTTDKIEYDMKYQDKGIEWLTFIPKGITEVIKKRIDKIQVFEIDATFPLRRYVTIIPQMIIHNVGYPIGFYMGPSENTNAYQIFFDSLQQLGVPYETIRKRPFLADMGGAIKHFLKANYLTYWICMRHFLNRFSSSVTICAMAKKVLKSNNASDYQFNYNYFTASIMDMHSKHQINNAMLKQWQKLDQKRDQLALYIRHPRIGPSNHAESFHYQWQKKMKNAGVICTSYRDAIRILVDYMLERLNMLHSPSHQNAINMFHKIQNWASMNQQKECNDYCNQFKKLMLEKYGVQLPCIHESTAMTEREIAHPPMIDSTQFDPKLESHDVKIIDFPNPKSCDKHDYTQNQIKIRSNEKGRFTEDPDLDFNDLINGDDFQENIKIIKQFLVKLYNLSPASIASDLIVEYHLFDYTDLNEILTVLQSRENDEKFKSILNQK